MSRSRQQFLVAVAAGTAAFFAARRIVRSRRAIDFAGRGVVITGGSRGLGLVIARRLAAEGAKLCLLARDSSELARAAAELKAFGTEVLTIRCDIRRRAEIRAAADTILQRWPAVDVLINNAGVIQVGPLEHMTPEDFENTMATHYWGPFHLMWELVPEMRRRGFGRIVNVSSIGGRIAIPHLAPYCASKFALVGLSEGLRTELAQYGIRVTTVTPGLMRTGSPPNADVKGRHESEYAWFAISDSLPGLSVAAERAADQIVEACRHGDPALTISLPAKVAVALSALAPSVVAEALIAVNRLLPGPTGHEGDRHKKGREVQSRWAPSAATILSTRAAVANNEM
jgi:NAD(P)-dependent dehydrogenase (short-subunit alcohol dehydrogenase family)